MYRAPPSIGAFSFQLLYKVTVFLYKDRKSREAVFTSLVFFVPVSDHFSKHFSPVLLLVILSLQVQSVPNKVLFSVLSEQVMGVTIMPFLHSLEVYERG